MSMSDLVSLPVKVSEDIASQLAAWCETRHGILGWPSADLSSDAGALTFTPAIDPLGAPNDNSPPSWKHTAGDCVRLGAADLLVETGREVMRKRVYLTRRGMRIVLTDSSSRKVRAWLERVNLEYCPETDGAWYEFDPPAGSIPFQGEPIYAVFYVPSTRILLSEWMDLRRADRQGHAPVWRVSGLIHHVHVNRYFDDVGAAYSFLRQWNGLAMEAI